MFFLYAERDVFTSAIYDRLLFENFSINPRHNNVYIVLYVFIDTNTHARASRKYITCYTNKCDLFLRTTILYPNDYNDEWLPSVNVMFYPFTHRVYRVEMTWSILHCTSVPVWNVCIRNFFVVGSV